MRAGGWRGGSEMGCTCELRRSSSRSRCSSSRDDGIEVTYLIQCYAWALAGLGMRESHFVAFWGWQAVARDFALGAETYAFGCGHVRGDGALLKDDVHFV